MRPHILNRRVHYWLSAAIALPLLVVVTTGILLQLKKQIPWVQPPEKRGSSGAPAIGFDRFLEAARADPNLDAKDWDDISRIDARPGRGVAKVCLKSGWELQVDMVTGQVMQTAYRRSDLIESLHDGSFFAGDWTRLGLFLPSGVSLLVLLLSGLWMFWHPIAARRKRARGIAQQHRVKPTAAAS